MQAVISFRFSVYISGGAWVSPGAKKLLPRVWVKGFRSLGLRVQGLGSLGLRVLGSTLSFKLHAACPPNARSNHPEGKKVPCRVTPFTIYPEPETRPLC